jgi:starch phosphorylase
MAHLAAVGSRPSTASPRCTRAAEDHGQGLRTSCGPRSSATRPTASPRGASSSLSNPRLTKLITDLIGEGWLRDLNELRGWSRSPTTRVAGAWREVKLDAKRDLATGSASARASRSTRPCSIVLAKRIHEYKRQHLNLLHIVWLYDQLKQNPSLEMAPRTFIFGGKAAPGYFHGQAHHQAHQRRGEVVNNDPHVNGLAARHLHARLQREERRSTLYPAADLSEQISMAGKEASGTGNMKFSMNGALTIGTLDGANVEIREEVGAENFFLFGLTVEEVQRRKREG